MNLEPENRHTKVKDIKAVPEWARAYLLEWYFGTPTPSPERVAVLEVFHVFSELGPVATTVVACARKKGPLEFHRLWKTLVESNPIAHSCDASFRIA